jgi:hypothetical protein
MNRQAFAEYGLRKLGAPLINIEIDDDQLEDCIKDVLDYYHEYHNDGIERDIYKYQVTAQDITNKYFTLPDGIVSIVRVMPFTGTNASGSYLMSGQYQFMLSELKWLQGGNTSNYYMSMDYINHVDFILNKEKSFRFNRRMNKLFLDVDWNQISVGMYLVVEVYRELDPADYDSIYDDRWLKKYFVANLKKQWGQNLSKYDRMELPGGVIINGWQIKEEAEREMAALEVELQSIEGPLLFAVG